MKYGKKTHAALKEEFIRHKPLTGLTPGKAIRIYRQLQGLSQVELAERAGLRQATISGLERDRITLGLDRAKAIARPPVPYCLGMAVGKGCGGAV